ncbi:MAG: hypothetical protein ABI839_08290 [Verrucomicrobiota bacterium]
MGPSLTAFGVTGVLSDPTIELRDSAGALVATNNDWRDTQADLFGPGGRYHRLQPDSEKESAIAVTVEPGAYTFIVRGNNGSTGVALAECYDVSPGADSQLLNVSTRSLVQVGDHVLIGGLVVDGDTKARVIVRALGPSLKSYGVNSVLANPELSVYDADGKLIRSCQDWQDDATQAANLVKNNYAPSNPREAAMIVTLPPGNYTAVISGENNTQGVALLEAYRLK